MTERWDKFPGFSVLGAHAALRDVWLAVRRSGLAAGRWGYTEGAEDLTVLPAVLDLGRYVQGRFGAGDWTEAQVLLRFPDPEDRWHAVQHEEHVDRTPAGGLYERVVGVALTDAPEAVVVDGTPVGVQAGDAVTWLGDVPHHGVLNRGSSPRVVIYWRKHMAGERGGMADAPV